MSKTIWRGPAMIAVGGLALLLGACAAPISAQTNTTDTSTTAAVSTTAAPTATGLTLAASDTSAAAASAPSAGQSQAASVADGDVLLTLASDSSKASYRATEQLAGHSLPNEAVGTTPAV